MELQQARLLLEQKEKYLKELALTLSTHIQDLSQVNEKISSLENVIQLKEKKFKRKSAQLEQEIKDKEIILARIKGLEGLLGSSNDPSFHKRSKTFSKGKTDTTANYLEFYSKLKNQKEINPVVETPVKVEEEKKDVFEIEMGNTSAITEEEILQELRDLGLEKIVNKYN
ncbi:unnamed protein product [Blepharisma stoltei]|uniref:Uncharacterized protein n=1 Tax=Blepharisma stoltei TaxID=1481888 RepID=A0AAU9ICV3_9CILI|nr:unnamed protein product [Blepharisma stoltei]